MAQVAFGNRDFFVTIVSPTPEGTRPNGLSRYKILIAIKTSVSLWWAGLAYYKMSNLITKGSRLPEKFNVRSADYNDLVF